MGWLGSGAFRQRSGLPVRRTAPRTAPLLTIKTASWFADLPADHLMIGISGRVPGRGLTAGLPHVPQAGGPWFNSVSTREYERLYGDKVLAVG
jgi:hypothetical protein